MLAYAAEQASWLAGLLVLLGELGHSRLESLGHILFPIVGPATSTTENQWHADPVTESGMTRTILMDHQPSFARMRVSHTRT